MPQLKQKKCPNCKTTKSINEFVNSEGQVNSRGRYCFSCYEIRERETVLEVIEKEKDYIRKLKIVYGNKWKENTFPHELQYTL